ncbi:cell division ATP-binding protein FtsE [Agromyces kandeliae]|uniref:Cell division ATP-binding protein FtsE n=1 Tax=Agromyces kandeliae TaxID=2666141 RepID=A0A6L5R5Q3_9MICO|nr:cell division ATP-binding protein FtsE [Agromyces kandeliae]MRX45309.1 cell division ATP-binding protein FtsE [Agromyces kandeliae]
MIRFDSVTKSYPGQTRPALDGITVEILRGEFVFLVGASGSGKSSFLRLILKEDRPTAGRIHVLGQDLRSISTRKVPYFRRNLGVVFQDFRLLSNKNVFENVAFALRVIGKSRGFVQTAVPETLKLVGLDGKGKRMPHELSGGEQQRVAIARAIVNKPQILLADEPTGNLDPVTSAGIMTLLERINASGTTVVMATHEAGIVDQMQRRVIELSSGEVVRDERSAGYAVGVALAPTTSVVGAVPGDAVPTDLAAAALAAVGAESTDATGSAADVEVVPVAASAASSTSTGETAAADALVASVRAEEALHAIEADTDAAATVTEPEPEPAKRPAPRKKRPAKRPAAKAEVVEQAADEASVDTPMDTGTVGVAAPKVTRKVMQDAPPLYVEPEERDAVTDEAAEITAAATMPVEPLTTAGAAEAGDDGGDDDDGDGRDRPPGRPAAPVSAKSAHLTLAERLGLRSPAGPRAGDDDQEVGPVK